MNQNRLTLTHRERSGQIGRGLSLIGGHAMVAADSSADALDHLATATELDHMGDLAMARVDRTLSRALCATSLADCKDLVSMARTALGRAIEIDEFEGEHWSQDAPALIAEAQDAGLTIVAFTERALTGGEPDAAA